MWSSSFTPRAWPRSTASSRCSTTSSIRSTPSGCARCLFWFCTLFDVLTLLQYIAEDRKFTQKMAEFADITTPDLIDNPKFWLLDDKKGTYAHALTRTKALQHTKLARPAHPHCAHCYCRRRGSIWRRALPEGDQHDERHHRAGHARRYDHHSPLSFTHDINLVEGLTRPWALSSQAQLSGRHQPHHLRLRERVLDQT